MLRWLNVLILHTQIAIHSSQCRFECFLGARARALRNTSALTLKKPIYNSTTLVAPIAFAAIGNRVCLCVGASIGFGPDFKWKPQLATYINTHKAQWRNMRTIYIKNFLIEAATTTISKMSLQFVILMPWASFDRMSEY